LNLKVNCEAGYSGCDHPKSLELNGQRQEIRQIIREWREPGVKHFLVETDSGTRVKLAFYEAAGEWKALEVSVSPKTQEH